MTKQFTAAAVMDLVEHGRLGVDDEITRLLPEYPAGRERPTVRDLLTHTSGIPNYTESPEFARLADRRAPREEIMNLFAGRYDFPLTLFVGPERPC